MIHTEYIDSKNDDLYARHFCILASKLWKGWFFQRNFLVLPNMHTCPNFSVVIPDLPILHDRSFQQKISQKTYPQEVNDIVLDDVIDLDSKWICEPKFKNTDQLVNQIVSSFFSFFLNPYANIYVRMGTIHFGTRSSFYSTRLGDDLHIQLLIRSDSNLAQLAFALVSILVVDQTNAAYEDEKELWIKRQNISEFILKHSTITQYVDTNQYDLTSTKMYSNSRYSHNLVQKCHQYVSSLGITLSRNKRLPDWNYLESVLSMHEFKLLKAMYRHKNSIISFDQLSQVLYQENFEEKFSLQYLAKLIQNIRHELDKIGYHNIIFTKRKKGYGWFEGV